MRNCLWLVCGVAVWLATTGSAGAVPTTIRFTNNEVNLGTNSQIDLTNQYSGYGLTFDHVYRYIDDRDPFSDAPNQEAFGDGLANLGISNGYIEDNFAAGAIGTVYFTVPTNGITFDWWTIGNTLHLTAYNGLDVVGTFSGSGSGTESIAGLITHFQFHDSGGFVQIANLTFDPVRQVPEPASLLAFGLGGVLLGGYGWTRRTRKPRA